MRRSLRGSAVAIAIVALLALVASVSASPSSTLSASTGDVPEFDVTAYGCVGDGSSDCTRPLAKAMAALRQGGKGGTIYFPKGNYVLTREGLAGRGFIDFPTTAASGGGAMGVRGAGADVTTIRFEDVAPFVFAWDVQDLHLRGFNASTATAEAQSLSFFHVTNLRLSELVLHGAVVSVQVGEKVTVHNVTLDRPAYSGITLSDVKGAEVTDLIAIVNPRFDAHSVVWVKDLTTDVVIRRAKFDSFIYGIFITMDTKRSEDALQKQIFIEDVTFLEFPDATGVFQMDCSQVRVVNCKFINPYSTPNRGGLGVLHNMNLCGDHPDPRSRLQVRDSFFQNLEIGVMVYTGINEISGNVFQDNDVGVDASRTDFTFDEAALLVRGNSFNATQGVLGVHAAIYAAQADRSVISDNKCTGSATDITVGRCEGCDIKQNSGCITKVGDSDSKEKTILSEL